MSRKQTTNEDLAKLIKKETTSLRKENHDLATSLRKENHDLAKMVKQGFDDVDKRFSDVDKRFNEAGKERKALKQGIDSIMLKFSYVAWNIDIQELKERVAILEKKLCKK